MKKNLDMGSKTSLQQTNFVSPLALRYIEVSMNFDFLIVWIILTMAQSIPRVTITQQPLAFISHLSALHLAAFDFSPNVESTIFCFQEVHLQRFLKALTGCSSALTKQYDTLVGTVLVRKYVLLQVPLVARNPNLQVVIMNAFHVYSQHLFAFPQRMNGIYITQFDQACLDLLSLVIWSCMFWPSVTWNLKTQSTAWEQKCFDLQLLSPAPYNLWLLLVYSLLVHVHFIHYRHLLTIFNHPDRIPDGHHVVMIQLKNSLNSWRACCLLRLIICGPVFV